MKAAFIRQPGPPGCIEFGDLAEPEVGAHDVLVRTGAVAVNPIDTYVRSGAVPMDLPFPFVVGCDVAGTVEKVGEKVARFRPGDRVFGSNQGLLGRQGTFSERVSVHEDWLYPTPENVGDENAAAAVLVGITAHLGLVSRARLEPGETLFVVGGTGGVGSMVVQMAKALGARVLTCCGSDEKCARARELGADVAFNYRETDLAEALLEHAPAGVDVFWETRRDPDLGLAVGSAAEGGRLVVMAGRDAEPVLPVGPFYVKELTLHGFVMFKAPAALQREAASELGRWLAEGKVRPLIGARFPLSETARAHQLQEANTVGGEGSLEGKIVLTP